MPFEGEKMEKPPILPSEEKKEEVKEKAGEVEEKVEKEPRPGEEEEKKIEEEKKKVSYPEVYEFLRKRGLVSCPEEFKKICEKKEIGLVIRNAPPGNLELAFKIYQIKTPEEFEKLCMKDEVGCMISFSKPENLKWALEFYQTKTPEEFENLCKKDKVRGIIEMAKPENLKWALEFFKIETPDQFERLCKKDKVIYMISFPHPENLKWVLEFYQIKTPEEFEKLSENGKVRSMISFAKPENLKWALEFFKVRTPDQFERLSEEKGVNWMISFAKPENLKWALEFYQIKTPEEFEKLCKKNKVRGMIETAKFENLKWALSFFQIETPEKFEELCGKIEVSLILEKAPLENLQKIKQKGEESLFDEELKKDAKILYQFLIEKDIREKLRKTKGNYFAKTFPQEILSLLSSSFFNDFLEYQKTENLEKLQEKKPEFYQKILHKDFHLEDLFLGRKALKRLVEGENFAYLATIGSLEKELPPFDYYGVLGKDFEEMKKEIDKLAKEIIEAELFEKKKEDYLLHLPSLLGYGRLDRELLNEILKEEDILSFKFEKEKELKQIVDQIKNIEYFPEEKKKISKEISLESYFSDLKKYFKEEFPKAKENLAKLIKREKGEELLKKIEDFLKKIEDKKEVSEKEINSLLSEKPFFRHLEMNSTWDTLSDLSKVLRGEETPKEVSIQKIEILKEAPEMFSAINVDPSCQKVGGEHQEKAFTLVQGPILIVGVKNTEGRIVGRFFLLPVKTEKNWFFEQKEVYGEGEKEVEGYVSLLEGTLGKGRIKKEIIEGKLPRINSKPSTKTTAFWRDEIGVVEFPQ